MTGPCVLGIDFGTESVRVGCSIRPASRLCSPRRPTRCAIPTRVGPEQQPDEWWSALVSATRRAIAESGIAAEEIVGLGADCTSCTVVALDERFRP